MIGEINLGGVFVPSIVLWCIAALIILLLIKKILARYYFYRHVWQHTLFNFAIFVIILGGIVFFVSLI